jgi:hypothetical protein
MIWTSAIVVALGLVSGGALYVRLRWRRSPQAYRATIALAACYFVAGSIAGAWLIYLTTPKPIVPPTQVAAPSAAAASPSTVVPTLKEKYTGPSFPIQPLRYVPAHAALPDPKLTPGDTFQGATASDVCTPGWSREHRHVTGV